MSDLFLLSDVQMRRIEPSFPRSRGLPRVDDRRIVSGIIYVIRNGLQWKDAPRGYGPHKTLYNRFVRWSPAGRVREYLRRARGAARANLNGLRWSPVAGQFGGRVKLGSGCRQAARLSSRPSPYASSGVRPASIPRH